MKEMSQVRALRKTLKGAVALVEEAVQVGEIALVVETVRVEDKVALEEVEDKEARVVTEVQVGVEKKEEVQVVDREEWVGQVVFRVDFKQEILVYLEVLQVVIAVVLVRMREGQIEPKQNLKL